jgi:hypothetical protein
MHAPLQKGLAMGLKVIVAEFVSDTESLPWRELPIISCRVIEDEFLLFRMIFDATVEIRTIASARGEKNSLVLRDLDHVNRWLL